MNEFEHSSEQAGLAEQTDGQSEGMDPLEGEGFFHSAEDAILGEEGAPSKKKKGALILVVVIGLAIGSLFSMHTLTKVTASSGQSTDIERTVEQFLGKLTGTGGNGGESSLVEDHAEVVEVLQDNYTQHQVKGLERDPFEMSSGGGGPEPIDPVYGLEQRRRQFEQAAEQLRLKSVIGGSRPLANINGRIVRLNQTIPVELPRGGGVVEFKVTEITRESVTVVSEDPELKLRVETVIKLKRNNGR